MRAPCTLAVLIFTLPAAALGNEPRTPPGTPPAQETLVRRTYLVAARGDTAYLGSTVGVVAVGIKDPNKPRYLGVLPLRGSVNGLALLPGGRLAVALGSDGVVLADFSDPARPRKLSRVRLAGAAMGLFSMGERLLVASGTAGVHLLDVKDPAKPRKIAHRDTPGYAREVIARGGAAYVADGRGGLAVFSLERKMGRLTAAGAVKLKGQARALALAGGRLLVACGPAGAALLDLAVPDKPKVAGWLPGQDMARGVAAAGDRAAVADGIRGVAVFSLEGKPRLLCRHVPRRSVNRVILRGDLALVANDHDGLLLLRLGAACKAGKAEVLGSLPAGR